MDRNPGDSGLSVCNFPPSSLSLPFLSDLFGLHARGGGALWRSEGHLVGAAPFGALPSPLPVGATPQRPEPAAVIETDLYKIAFSNQGGTVRSWLLKKYKGNDNKTLDLVNTAAGVDFPYSLYFPNEKPAVNVNWTW